MSKPRLVLHIGHPKTGTTSIQTFLLANRIRLKAAGILYPETGIHDSAHRLLSPSFYAANHFENRAFPVLQNLLREIDASGCHTVVLSFEGFCGDNPACFIPLRDRFDTTVIYYMRRQDHVAESRYAQHIRSFLKQEIRPASLAIHAPDISFDNPRVLRLFAAVFGRDRLAVRVFECESLVRDDVIADFLQAAALDPPPGLVPSTSSNATLKRPYLAFLRHCNAIPLLKEEHHRLELELTGLSQADRTPYVRHVLSPADRRLILDRHAGINAALAREWLGRSDGVLFHEPPPADAEPWGPLEPLAPDAQRAIDDRLSSETRDCLSFLYRPRRTALPEEPILPFLPDGDPSALDRLAERRSSLQLQRQIACLERLVLAANKPSTPPRA